MTDITAPERTADELLDAIRYVIEKMSSKRIDAQFKTYDETSHPWKILTVLAGHSAQEIFDGVENDKMTEQRIRDDINKLLRAYPVENVLKIMKEMTGEMEEQT